MSLTCKQVSFVPALCKGPLLYLFISLLFHPIQLNLFLAIVGHHSGEANPKDYNRVQPKGSKEQPTKHINVKKKHLSS